jgi:ADP-ribose diphosphatase
MDNRKPKILSIRTTARSNLFEIEAVRLQFSNGYEAEYERVSSSPIHGAVVVVPMLNSKTFLLVREYAVGFDRYELGLPKGLLRAGESVLDAANRELMEEVGYSANDLTKLYTLSIASGFMCYATQVVIATNLVPGRMPGDEPEALQVVAWPMEKLDALVTSCDVSDARSVAALFLARAHLENSSSCFFPSIRPLR